MCVHVERSEPSIIPIRSLSARAGGRTRVRPSHTDAEKGGPGVAQDVGHRRSRRRGRSDYRARASGCPRRVRPASSTIFSLSLPRAILPVSPFLEHGPRGIPLDFSASVPLRYPGTLTPPLTRVTRVHGLMIRAGSAGSHRIRVRWLQGPSAERNAS